MRLYRFEVWGEAYIRLCRTADIASHLPPTQHLSSLTASPSHIYEPRSYEEVRTSSQADKAKFTRAEIDQGKAVKARFQRSEILTSLAFA